MNLIPEDAAVEQLRSGRLVVVPTETVYGLAANAFDAKAVARIFEVKNRPTFNPLIVHVATVEQLRPLTQSVSPMAFALAKRFWPGPLTLVLRKSDRIPEMVTAGGPLVAVRVPSHPVMQSILRAVDFPLAAPSANPSQGLSPTLPEHIAESILNAGIDVVDGGPCAHGVESTIVDLTERHPVCLRLGAIPLEEIEKVTGPLNVATDVASPRAPGMQKRHYAPTVPLKLVEATATWPLTASQLSPHAALLSPFAKDPQGFSVVEILSRQNNLVEAAANLFPALHRLQQARPSCIYAVLAPEEGLGRAINDRLRRAAAQD